MPESDARSVERTVGAGQLGGDKECPFSGVTSSGRVWRKVPESDARSVSVTLRITRERNQGPRWLSLAPEY